jgi:hypothetical protein
MPEDDQYEYEAPSADERESLTVPQDVESRADRKVRMETERVRREAQIQRTTALHLAVEWTASADEVAFPSLLGLADLMLRYIETGAKPTLDEFNSAVRPEGQ